MPGDLKAIAGSLPTGWCRIGVRLQGGPTRLVAGIRQGIMAAQGGCNGRIFRCAEPAVFVSLRTVLRGERSCRKQSRLDSPRPHLSLLLRTCTQIGTGKGTDTAQYDDHAEPSVALLQAGAGA